MMQRSTNVARLSAPALMSWLLAALVGASGLVAEFGYRVAPLSADDLRMIYILGLLLFICSRVLLLLNDSVVVAARVERWWPDYVLIIAAAFWWLFNSQAEYVILRMGAIYTLLTAAGALLAATWRRIVSPDPQWATRSPTLRLLGVGLCCALLGGGVLSLPACWARPVTGEKATQYANHVLNCLLTATAALTGTGLTPHDLEHDFSRAGLIVLLVLMQVGGVLIVLLAATTAWRFRRVSGVGTGREDTSAHGLAKVAVFALAVMLLAETAAGLVLYWQISGTDLKPPIGWVNWPAALKAAFAAVSGFCNTGLTLTRNLNGFSLYGLILPLMILGSIGAPPLYELFGRIVRRRPVPVSFETRATLIGTAVLTLVGAALLYTVESTRDWQLRYPRTLTPGRLQLAGGESGTGAIEFSAEDSERARSERLRSMDDDARALSGGFLAASATTGGAQDVRLDEASISPATRLMLVAWMLIGGGLGGTAGGIRLVLVCALLMNALQRRRYSMLPEAVDVGTVLASTAENPAGPRADEVAPLWTKAADWRDSVPAAAAAGVGMLLLVGVFTLLLLYRETGSFEASLMETVSASCNAGFSAGLTPLLSPFGRSALILAMLVGRVLPFGILLRWSTPR